MSCDIDTIGGLVTPNYCYANESEVAIRHDVRFLHAFCSTHLAEVCLQGAQ